jgi:hypothetical protein
VFKARLYAIRIDTSIRGFLVYLTEIARTINIVRLEGLLARITPYEAWFRRPHIL